MNESKTVTVLLIEDDPADQKLVKVALANQENDCEIFVAETGEEALRYLRQSNEDELQNPQPNMILLDLNMPGMGGKEFLREIKADDDLCFIPVVILTTSDSEIDIEECYKLQASGYIQKSAGPVEFQQAVGKIAKYWFKTSLTV
jgi:CheY-like chemotaxis protein